jgi:membrane-associated phospholipid phosphatase
MTAEQILIEVDNFKLFEFSSWHKKHFLIAGLISLILSLASMFYIDHELAVYLREVFGRSLFKAANMITWIGLAEMYFILSLLGVLIFKGLDGTKIISDKVDIKTFQKIFSTMFFSFLYSGIIGTIIKIIVGRCRPYNSPNYEALYFKHFNLDWNFQSYPSGHTQVVFTFVTFMSLIFPKWTKFFLIIGVAVAASRIVLEYHYLGDVIAGAYVGFIGTQLAFKKADLLMIKNQKSGFSKGF